MTVATAAVAAAGGEDEIEPEEDVFSSLAPESPEEILAQVSTKRKLFLRCTKISEMFLIKI